MGCAEDIEKCDAAQMTSLNGYIKDFLSVLQDKATYKKDGNGAFIHSCYTHMEALGYKWNAFAVNGVTMQQAFSKWWRSDSEAASAHSSSPCLYRASSYPHQCNPTCEAEPIVVS